MSDDWRIGLTSEEKIEMERRIVVQALAQGAIAWANNQPGFVGQYFDHKRAGLPVFVFENEQEPRSASLRAYLGGVFSSDAAYDLQFIDYGALVLTANEIDRDLQQLRRLGVDVEDYEIDATHDRVSLGVRNLTDDGRSILEARYQNVDVYALVPEDQNRLRTGRVLPLRNLSCDPIETLEVGERYLVSNTFDQRLRPGVHRLAIWRLARDGAELVFMSPADEGLREEYMSAVTVGEAIRAALTATGLPATDTSRPRPPTEPAEAPLLPLLIGALAGLLVLARPHKLWRS